MHMVGHQGIGMQGDVVCLQRIDEECAIARVVSPVQEHRAAIYAALGDVQGKAGQFESGAAWHGKGDRW
ncbi:hypothetical protein A6R72_13085 [Xanthomonas translucens pv. graminis]|nr:hypothetical protein A6R72_13085 [Xanthomonas translucens pv. graminis]